MRHFKLRGLARGSLLSLLGLSPLSCGSDDPAPQVKSVPQQQPLQQTRSVPFQVGIGDGESVTLHMPAPAPGEGEDGGGMSQLMMEWCVHRNVFRDDDKLCSEFAPSTFTGTGGFDLQVPLATLTDPTPLQACKANLCEARIATCIGYLAKELETSPTDIEFSWSEFGEFDEILAGQLIDLSQYGVSESDLDKLPEDWSPASIRFSAPASPGRASLARISSFAHQYATRIGELLATTDAGSGLTCAQEFANADGMGTPTGIPAGADGRLPTFTDVFVQSYMDSAIEYQRAVHRAVAEMKGSAETQAMKLTPGQGTQLIWNGDVDSARTIANFIGYGAIDSNNPPAPGPTPSATDCSPGTASPTAVPVCPPGLTDRTRALTQLMRALEVPPVQPGNDLLGFLNAFRQYQTDQGQTPVNTPAELASALGVSLAEIQSANDYLCAEAQVFNLVQTPNGSGGVFGVTPPQSQLSGAAVAVNFLGASPNAAANDPTSPEYAMSGALRGIDAVKRTSSVVQDAASQTATDPELSSALQDFIDGLEAEAGEHRIKWEIGSPDGSGNVEDVAVSIYGVKFQEPTPGTFVVGERFFAVQGIDALKCVVNGSVDGAPCVPTNFLLDLNESPGIGTFSDSVPADQPDLADAGTLSASFSNVTRNGSATPISVAQPLYLLRKQQKEGVVTYEAFGGVLPAPEGGSPGGGVTRTVWTPAGGTLEEVLAQALTPNTNDCSKVQESCAGLPVDLWPPLESEINGDPNSAQNYESAWKRYLQLAKDASTEADRRGEELLQQGLSMDLRREEYEGQLLEYCGADGDGETGCSEEGAEANPLLADVPWATLGDKDVCAWEYEGRICGVPNGVMPPGLTCPMPADNLGLSDEEGQEAANKAACRGLLVGPALLPEGIEAIPVVHKLRYAVSEFPPIEGLCGTFSALRRGYHTDPETQEQHDLSTSEARSNYIRKVIAPHLSQKTVQDVMRRLVYREEFADHYTLEFDGQPIFKTDRPFGRPSPNDQSIAPCNVKPSDQATGSEFWTEEVSCYVSGVDCVNQAAEIGRDGCDGASTAQLSLDTEPEALRNRWAWGFGHLRRSVATLGVMTGEMNDRFFVAGIWNAAWDPGFGVVDTSLSCKNRGTSHNDPPWMQRCRWNGKEYDDSMWCVTLPGASGTDGKGGVGSDTNRISSGRPVNYNGFIANRIPFVDHDDRTQAAGIGTFPWHCDTAPCRAGVDPQMVYCGFPDPSLLPNADPGSLFSAVANTYRTYNGESSGFVGTSHVSSAPAKFKKANGNAWSDALARMWTVPDGDFCWNPADVSLDGAIWKALCVQVADDTGLVNDPEFMHYGRLPHPGTTYVNARQIATWIHVNAHDSPHAEALFDSRDPNKHEFQYPLTQRNVFDALELACHAQQFSSSGGVRCEDVSDLEHLPNDLDQIAGILSCQASNLDKAVRNYVIPGVPRVLLDAVDKESAVTSTSGLGGQYLAEINNMHAALKQVTRGYGAMRDAHAQLALAVKTHSSIAEEDKALDKATLANQLATTLDAMLQVLSSSTSGSNPWSGLTGAANAGLAYAAAGAKVTALEFQNQAADEQLEQKRIANIQSMVSQLGSARAGADEVVLGLNALNLAAANLRLVRKKADIAKSRMEFSDYASGDVKNPQFVNIVMRRTYNTRLIRYQTALERAKRLAFIARRAIELRFGVDLTRMTSDMTLVDAPAGWANKICDLTGIDYAAIREPSPDGASNKWKAGGPPPEGDDFANQYVGDYVTWLEDFVNSYPFDKPLQDGDDFAVISLRDDIMGAKGECAVPGDNYLYFSTEFDKQDPENGAGWQVEECEQVAPEVPEDEPGTTQDWDGCITRRPSGLSATELVGLPAGAVAYAVQSSACDDQFSFCPAGATYTSTGWLAQYFVPTSGLYHMASLYVMQDPTADNAQYASHNAQLRVDRVFDDGTHETVATHTFKPPATWERINTPAFPVIAGETYRIALFTLDDYVGVTVGGPNPGYFVAAAQVEAAGQLLDGTYPLTPGTWHRTDVSRNVVDPACVDAAPQGMRKNFRYKCDYICRDGIGNDCPADSEEAVPVNCFYEANFNIDLERIESGELIPSGQLAIGNFNFRHNQVGINLVGTNVKTCEGVTNASCFGNGFVEYTLVHSGATKIRNYDGDALPAKMDNGYIEHGKGLATERLITNPPSSADEQQLSSYMKREFKGRPLQGLYTIRIWDTPGLRWENLEDIQLVWKYHYWSRFQK